jgi:hypothetical protein
VTSSTTSSLLTLRDVADEDSPVFSIPELPELDHEPVFDLRLADSDNQAHEWDNRNNWFRLDDQARVQEALLNTADALVAAQLCRSPRMISGAATPLGEHAAPETVDAQTVAVGRDSLLNHPLQVALPPLPTATGQSTTFTAGLRERLATWLHNFPIFGQLQVPVKAILIVVLPAKLERQRNATGKGTDLDNVMRKIMPAVHEVLALKPEPWVDRFRYLPRDIQDKRRDRYDRLLKLNKRSVAAYEIIELSRAPGDPIEGVVRLAFGNATLPGSTWSNVTDFVRRAIDRTYP